MLGSPILDVAIGMAFLYLLLSLIASATQEVLASIIQSRSANLQRGIRSLFSNDRVGQSVTFFEALYDHGLVRGLYQVPAEDYTEDPRRERLRRIFGRFRLGLRWILGMKVPGLTPSVNDLLLPSYIPSRVVAMALKDILNQPQPHGWDSMRNIEANLLRISASLKRPGDGKNLAAEALLVLVKDAAGDPAKLQTNLENWFNDTMDRVSGWYKRYVQTVLICIGLLLAMIFNVDSIHVARTLWLDKDARAGLAVAAGDYLHNHLDAPVVPAVADAGSAPAATPQVDTDDLAKNLQGTVAAYNNVASISLVPVGWKHNLAYYRTEIGWKAVPRLLLAMFGWIITAIALSYGAPFWFDTLNKVMVVRNTVKPQEKSQVEPSKDS